MTIIDALDPVKIREGQWDQYTHRYNREVVMEKFDRHLIQPALANAHPDKPDIKLGLRELGAYYGLKVDMFMNSTRYP